MKKYLKIDFVRFCIVGSVGFLVTAITLRLVHGLLGLDITLATLLGGEVGLLSNFVFHETWTYKHVNHKGKPISKKLIHFHMSSWSGVAIITGIESVCVKAFHLNYLIALVIASGITLFWNFFWTKYFIFKGHTPTAEVAAESVLHSYRD